MKCKRRIFILLAAMLFLLSMTVYAQEPVLEFYSRPIAEAFENGNTEAVKHLEDEIKEQIQAIMEINNIPEASVLRSFSLDNTHPVKIASAGSSEAAEILEQLSSADDVVMRKIAVSSEDIFESRFLEYIWKVPVIETENEYLFSVVKINSSGDTVVSSTIAPKREMSDVSYLFDEELVPSILKDSGLNVDYEIVLPVSIPIISTDIIIFSADDLQYAIVFSARPDLLGLENGSVYKYTEVEAAIKQVIDGMSSPGDSSAMPAGSGMGQGASDGSTLDEEISSFLFPLCVIVIIGSAGCLFVFKTRRGKSE